MPSKRKKKEQPPSLEDILRESLMSESYVTTLVEASKDKLKVSLWWDQSEIVHEFEVDKNTVCHINSFETNGRA